MIDILTYINASYFNFFGDALIYVILPLGLVALFIRFIKAYIL